ncbi:unnamed protein product [Trichogramma brassicae]|uniref:Uncharacterized protein n=1 Tax=Trichogramma brassicae TaxID=86971 RepID=A0A6H5IQA8_9HYME|nr:unnamed protein product [Trichogramma brassicae]
MCSAQELTSESAQRPGAPSYIARRGRRATAAAAAVVGSRCLSRGREVALIPVRPRNGADPQSSAERCGYNTNPILTHCVKNIQYAVLVTLLVPSSGTNCEADTARLLISNFNSIISTESQNIEDLINKELESWYISDDLHHNEGDDEKLKNDKKDKKKDKNKDNNVHDDNDDNDDVDDEDDDSHEDQDEDDDDDDTKQLIKIPRLKITELVEPKLFEHAKTICSRIPCLLFKETY